MMWALLDGALELEMFVLIYNVLVKSPFVIDKNWFSQMNLDLFVQCQDCFLIFRIPVHV